MTHSPPSIHSFRSIEQLDSLCRDQLYLDSLLLVLGTLPPNCASYDIGNGRHELSFIIAWG